MLIQHTFCPRHYHKHFTCFISLNLHTPLKMEGGRVQRKRESLYFISSTFCKSSCFPCLFPFGLCGLSVKFHLKNLCPVSQGKNRNRTALPTLGQRKKRTGSGKGVEGEALNQESWVQDQLCHPLAPRTWAIDLPSPSVSLFCCKTHATFTAQM